MIALGKMAFTGSPSLDGTWLRNCIARHQPGCENACAKPRVTLHFLQPRVFTERLYGRLPQ